MTGRDWITQVKVLSANVITAYQAKVLISEEMRSISDLCLYVTLLYCGHCSIKQHFTVVDKQRSDTYSCLRLSFSTFRNILVNISILLPKQLV